MLQPFYAFRKEFVSKLEDLKHLYLVTQTYHRAEAAAGTTPILLTTYDDIGLAKTHVNALKHDKYAAIIQLAKPAHKQKLLEMLEPSSQYKLFWAVVKSVEELQLRLNREYKDHIRRFIDKNTNWRIGRDTTLKPQLLVIFGELYITLKWGDRSLRIKFEEIEKA